jgi:hypothetical protein
MVGRKALSTSARSGDPFGGEMIGRAAAGPSPSSASKTNAMTAVVRMVASIPFANAN